MRPYLETLPVPDGQSWIFTERRLPDGIPFQWHYHREYELTLTLNSAGQRFVGDHVGTYGDGDLVLLGPDIPHTWSSIRKLNEGSPHVALIMFFRPEWVENLIAGLAELSSLKAMLTASRRGLHFSIEAAERARALVEQMRHLDPAYRLLRLLDLLVMLAGDHGRELLTSPKASQMLFSGPDRLRLERVLDYIHGNYDRTLQIEELAELAHLSASGLHRMFMRHVRQSITDYIGQLRIGRACQLLVGSDTPIAHVAERVGYKNLSLFNRQFKRAKGETPRIFRRTFKPQAKSLQKSCY